MESKHAAAATASQSDAMDDDGWPITDIIEELDDDDNVVSYRLVTADDSMSHVQKALEKAGITAPSDSKPTAKEGIPQDASASAEKPAQEIEMLDASSSTPAKKSVSFSDEATPKEEPRLEMPFRARRVEQIMNTAKEQESISKETPIIPEDEDPEDAALRQEMLKYGMGEIGAVVAELQLEEGDSDDSGFDYDDEGFDEESDDEDAEDEYGRNGRVVTDQYRHRMLELEKKLGIASCPSKAPPAGHDKDSSDDEGISRIKVNRGAEASSSGSKATTSKSIIKEKPNGEPEGKKSVRFASSLDIAPEKESAAPAPQEIKDVVDPLSDIVERSIPSNPTTRQPTNKVSRFKKATGAVPKGPMDMAAQFADQDRPSAPSGPEGTTIADTLVEREPTSNVVPPDEFDGSIAYQEVADEYQKMRKKFIQREGGFLKEDASPVQPIVDEDQQEPMSRFKAARLSRQ